MFETCKKLKRFLKDDARLFCLLSLSLTLNNSSVSVIDSFNLNNITTPEAMHMIKTARKSISTAMEFHCHSQQKFFDGGHLIFLLGDIKVATQVIENFNNTVFDGNSNLSENIPGFIQLYKTWLEEP